MNPCTIASSRREIEREFCFQNPTDKQRAVMEALNFLFDRMSTATTMGQTTKTGETLIFCYSAARFQFFRFSMTKDSLPRVPDVIPAGNYDHSS
jgi:hypothetical protein